MAVAVTVIQSLTFALIDIAGTTPNEPLFKLVTVWELPEMLLLLWTMTFAPEIAVPVPLWTVPEILQSKEDAAGVTAPPPPEAWR